LSESIRGTESNKNEKKETMTRYVIPSIEEFISRVKKLEFIETLLSDEGDCGFQ